MGRNAEFKNTSKKYHLPWSCWLHSINEKLVQHIQINKYKLLCEHKEPQHQTSQNHFNILEKTFKWNLLSIYAKITEVTGGGHIRK